MTEQDINIKIAEYMGYSKSVTKHYDYHINGVLPDYCNDLNAVWYVEEKLGDDRLWNNYSRALWDVLKLKIGIEKRYVNITSLQYETYITTHATAKQKCEAIIKVLEGM